MYINITFIDVTLYKVTSNLSGVECLVFPFFNVNTSPHHNSYKSSLIMHEIMTRIHSNDNVIKNLANAMSNLRYP